MATWLPPGGTTGHVHRLEPREGDEFRISLTDRDPGTSPGGRGGKTAADTDTHCGRFVELVPDERIVEVVEFEAAGPAFAGGTRVVVTLRDAAEGTEVAYRCGNLPPGTRPEDNEAGGRSSPRQLAALVE